jgi:hypothetical protein
LAKLCEFPPVSTTSFSLVGEASKVHPPM